MAIHPVRSIAALLCALAGTTLAGAACASRPAAPPDAGAQQAPAPLAALASERVVLVPSQRLREVGALGWTASLPSPREFLSGLDDEIAAALAERGVGSGWVMPADVVRSARRNPTYATDPYALSVNILEPGHKPPSRESPLAEPLATQLRTITALGDARYVLVPVELRFERLSGPGADTSAGRAVLRVALLDARASQLKWMGDVSSDPAPAFTPALAAGVASRLADMIAPR